MGQKARRIRVQVRSTKSGIDMVREDVVECPRCVHCSTCEYASKHPVKCAFFYQVP